MGPYRPRREFQSLRDFSVLPTFEIVQQHDLSLYLGELAQGLLEHLPELRSFRHPIGRRSPRSGTRRNLICLPKRLSSNQVLGTVSDNGHQPSPEAIRVPAFLESIQRHQERLLCCILRILVTTGDGVRNCVRRPLVPLDQLAEGLFTALQRQPNQLTVCRSVGHDKDTEGWSRVELLLHRNLRSVVITKTVWSHRRPRPRRRGRAGRSGVCPAAGGDGGRDRARAPARPSSPSCTSDVPTTSASRSGMRSVGRAVVPSSSTSAAPSSTDQNPRSRSGVLPARPPDRPLTRTAHVVSPWRNRISSTGTSSVDPDSSRARAGIGRPSPGPRRCEPDRGPPFVDDVPWEARSTGRAEGGDGGRAGVGVSASRSDIVQGCRWAVNSPYYLRLARPR